MLFLFTGEEKFLLDKQINQRKQAFIKKYPSSNLYIFNETNFNPEEIAIACAGGGLFEEKKFIIIKGVPKDSFTKINSADLEKLEKFFTEHIKNLPEENVIIFVSYKPDKRTKFYKFLAENCQIKEFKPLNEKQLVKFISENYGLSLENAKYLIEKLGTNLYLIHNELTKVKKITSTINKEIIDKYIIKTTQQDAFELLDNLSNKTKALKIINNLETNKEDFFKVLGLLYWNLKNIFLINEQLQSNKSAKEIASKLSIHPFVVNKIIKSNYNIEKLKTLFSNLIQLDFNIKSGKIPAELGYLHLKKII